MATIAEQDAEAIRTGDYMKHSQRWVGPNTDRRAHPPISNECLAALRDAAKANGNRPLSDAARAAIMAKFQ